MDITKNLKSAISAITGQLSTLKTELADTNREIGSIDGRIHELRAMPVSLKDYGSFLRAKIEKLADEHMGMLEFNLFRNAESLGAYSGETGQSFHAKLDSHSRANWTVGA